MHLRIDFDAFPVHSPFGFMHLIHQNLSASAIFCLNSHAKVNTQLLIYDIYWVYLSLEFIFIGWLVKLKVKDQSQVDDLMTEAQYDDFIKSMP